MLDTISNHFIDALKLVFPIVISAIVGNYLIQRWQQRNWRQQQLVLRGEKNIEALKAVIDDFMRLADTRSYRTRRLVLQMRLSPEEGKVVIDEQIKKDYIESVVIWNEKLNSMVVRLTMYAPQGCSRDLEERIQTGFYQVSNKAESALRSIAPSQRELNSLKSEIGNELNWLNGVIGELCKDLIRSLKEREKLNYLGKEIEFGPLTIEQFSTWQLIEALFKFKKSTLTIFSPTHDID